MMKKISRRDTLFYITLASVAAGLPAGCKTDDKAEAGQEGHENMHDNSDGFKNLSEEDKLLLQQKFFTDYERETVRVLANRIIPADEKSGNAEQAGCVPFIEFMMLDFPEEYEIQTKMRGGLAWLNAECMKRFNVDFATCTETQQNNVLDDIAYPDTAKPEMSHGVEFFNLFRDFTAFGFWSSKMGIEDLQYMGNLPNAWDGPPQAWLEKLGVAELI
ncbi:MAG: gluconate 2-dehydrogenase subunit 3 family protein [Saprospiraceae bacterium]|nr:gluconate 2-dehydrogenase subunit 3 family protein [Saprospiraceae bacterium]